MNCQDVTLAWGPMSLTLYFDGLFIHSMLPTNVNATGTATVTEGAGLNEGLIEAQ